MSIPRRTASCPLTLTKAQLKTDIGTYDGDLKDGKPHGFGEYKLFNGEVYYGIFLSGKFSRGKKIIKDPYDQFNGKIHPIYWDGKWDGFEFKSGLQFNEDGTILSGNWVNGKLEGLITKKFPDGNKLHCHYKYGISLGFAKMEYKNGDILLGIVIDDKFHGYHQLVIKKPKEKIKIHGQDHDENIIINGFYENGARKDLSYQCMCQ